MIHTKPCVLLDSFLFSKFEAFSFCRRKVVISVARPVIFRGTGVGPGSGVVDAVALGVSVGVETEIVGGATVGVGSSVR